MAGCFLLDSPIKIQYSTSCGERGPLLNIKYIHGKLNKDHLLPLIYCLSYISIKDIPKFIQ
jgi:hypothetical protein